MKYSYHQIAGFSEDRMWIDLHDGTRVPWVQKWYLMGREGDHTGAVSLWKGHFDIARIEAVRWRCWERIEHTWTRIENLIRRVVPADLKAPQYDPKTGGYRMGPGTRHVLAAHHFEGEDICYYSIERQVPERVVGWPFRYCMHWAREAYIFGGQPPPEPSPEGQELHRLDRYHWGLFRRMGRMSTALTLAVAERLGKDKMGNKVRVRVHGREYWFECFAPGHVNPNASPYWQCTDRPEDTRITLLDLNHEEAA